MDTETEKRLHELNQYIEWLARTDGQVNAARGAFSTNPVYFDLECKAKIHNALSLLEQASLSIFKEMRRVKQGRDELLGIKSEAKS